MTPSNTELMTSVQKWTQDFFERFPKSEWSYNIGVYGNVFCLDKSTWSPSFKVRIVADEKWKKNHWFVGTSGAGGQGFGGSRFIQSTKSRFGFMTMWTNNLKLLEDFALEVVPIQMYANVYADKHGGVLFLTANMRAHVVWESLDVTGHIVLYVVTFVVWVYELCVHDCKLALMRSLACCTNTHPSHQAATIVRLFEWTAQRNFPPFT